MMILTKYEMPKGTKDVLGHHFQITKSINPQQVGTKIHCTIKVNCKLNKVNYQL